MSVKNLVLTLLAAQLEVWLKQKVDPEKPIYNLGRCVNISGRIDPILFEAALQQTLAEAEALCARIIEGGEMSRQFLNGSHLYSKTK